jgi:hypothetical protein
MVDLNRHSPGIPPATPGGEPAGNPTSPSTTAGQGNSIEPLPAVTFGSNGTGGIPQHNLGNLPITPVSQREKAEMRQNYLKAVREANNGPADSSTLIHQYVQGNITPSAIRETIIRNSPHAPGRFGMPLDTQDPGKAIDSSSSADDSIDRLFDQLLSNNTRQHVTGFANIMKRTVGTLLHKAGQAALQQTLVVHQQQATGGTQRHPQ